MMTYTSIVLTVSLYLVNTLLSTESTELCPLEKINSDTWKSSARHQRSQHACMDQFAKCLQNDDCLIMMTLTFAYCFNSNVKQPAAQYQWRNFYEQSIEFQCDNMCAIALTNLLNFNRSSFRGEDLLHCKESYLREPVWRTPWMLLYRQCEKEIYAVKQALQRSSSEEEMKPSALCSVDCTLAAVACMSDRICRINILYAFNEGCSDGHCSEHCARSLQQLHKKSTAHYRRVFTCYFASIDYSIFPCGDPYATRPHLEPDEKAMAYLHEQFGVLGRSTSASNFLPTTLLFVRKSRDVKYIHMMHSIMRDQACLPNNNVARLEYVSQTKPLCYLRREQSPIKALRSFQVTQNQQAGIQNGKHPADNQANSKLTYSERFLSLSTCVVIWLLYTC